MNEMSEAQQLAVATTFLKRYDASDPETLEHIKEYIRKKGISEEVINMAQKRVLDGNTDLVKATDALSLTNKIAIEKQKMESSKASANDKGAADRVHAPKFDSFIDLQEGDGTDDLCKLKMDFEDTLTPPLPPGISVSDVLLGSSSMKKLLKVCFLLLKLY